MMAFEDEAVDRLRKENRELRAHNATLQVEKQALQKEYDDFAANVQANINEMLRGLTQIATNLAKAGL